MIRINLLETGKREIKDTEAAIPSVETREKKKLPIGPIIFLLLAAGIIGLYLYQKNQLSQEEELLRQAQAQRNQLRDVLTKLDQLEQQKNLLDRKISLIQQLQSRQAVAVNIMSELSKHIPEWVWLTEVTYRGSQIQIKGRGLSNSLIADYMTSLKNSTHFSTVNLINTNQRKVRNDEYVEFAMTAQYQFPIIPVATTRNTEKGGGK